MPCRRSAIRPWPAESARRRNRRTSRSARWSRRPDTTGRAARARFRPKPGGEVEPQALAAKAAIEVDAAGECPFAVSSREIRRATTEPHSIEARAAMALFEPLVRFAGDSYRQRSERSRDVAREHNRRVAE